MQALLELIARHRAGEACGTYSVCSAHPLAIEAALVQARRSGASLALVEATCNQVNQEGGYTGMVPDDFRDFAHAIADRVGLPRTRVVLGGDHLGPNPWQGLPAEQAMANARTLVAQYVAAGFRKIHLDCSMPCADDAVRLGDETVARRSAELCAVAERSWARAGGEPPVYVIGTEVPVPGGAHEELFELAVTAPQAVRATVETHRSVFAQAGLEAAWTRVIAAVVQPGVEFDHHKVVAYEPARARALSAAIENIPRLVYEAHSTDYQTPEALAQLVRDHFAILKVGPAVTFAVREALWALDAIESEWLGAERASRLRAVTLACMRADPRHWSKYYPSDPHEQHFCLEYSLSDRIRYYWTKPQIVAAQEALFRNLRDHRPPLALISQYLPEVHRRVRADRIGTHPEALVVEHVCSVLEDYDTAVTPQRNDAP
jgi:D-tagatose-1,6-bisphosphate aldolase subunit GatZ/KbaZ